MIPQGGSIRNEPVQERQQPSLTWKIDWEKGRVLGMTDGLDAVQQAVFLILQAERFRHLIYSFNYGHELNQLIGRSSGYVQSELNRMLNEALTQDDRINRVEITSLELNGDSALVLVSVDSIFGTIEQEVEVGVRGPDI